MNAEKITSLEAGLLAATTPPERIRALAALAFELYTHNPQRGAALAEEAVAQARALNSRSPEDSALLAVALRGYGACHSTLANQEIAQVSLLEAKQLYTALGDLSGQAGTSTLLGNLYFNLGEYQAAIEHHYISLHLRETLGEKNLVARAIFNLANAYLLIDNYALALDFYVKSLMVFISEGDRLGEASAQMGIANVHFKTGNLHQAIESHAKNLPLFRALADRQSIGYTLGNLGILSVKLGQHSEALKFFAQAFDLFSEANDRRNLANTMFNIADVYEITGNLVEAKRHADACLALNRDTGDKSGEGDTSLVLGRIALRQDEPADALEHFSNALCVADEIGSSDLRLKSYRALASFYKSRGDAANALAYFEKFYAVERDVFSADSDRRVKYLMVEFQVDRAQRESELYRLKNVELARALAEVEALQTETERQRLEAERQKFEAERQTAEAERQKVEAERQKVEAERQTVEAVWQRAAADWQKTEAERQKAEAEHQRALAQEASRLKTDLLGIAAHDLKNPLTAIMNFSDMLLTGGNDLMRDKQYISLIGDLSRRMLYQIDEMLNTAAIESGKLTLRKRKVDVAQLAALVVMANEARAMLKGQPIHLTTATDTMAEVDEDRIREVLDNLVSNAVKYSTEGKPIWVRVENGRVEAGDEREKKDPVDSFSTVRVSVRDEGQGLDAEDLQKLFGRFQRLSSKPTGGEGSTGLGLFIAKQLVELHGGRIWAESAGKDKGATFFIELPSMDIPVPAAAQPD